MSVRRLAEPSVQPPAFVFSPDYSGQVKTWIGKYPKGREQSAVIPLLMLAQDQEGWVSKAAIEHVADMLGMPYIRALEVATFYTQFQLKPVGTRAHVQVCGTTPCMLRGAEALMDVCRSRIHHDQFHTNPTGTLSWEEVECLGACVNAPMVMIFKDTYEDLTPERLGEIIELFDAGNGKQRAHRPAGRSHRLRSAVRIDVASRRDGNTEVDPRRRKRAPRFAKPWQPRRRRHPSPRRRRTPPSRRPMPRKPTRRSPRRRPSRSLPRPRSPPASRRLLLTRLTRTKPPSRLKTLGNSAKGARGELHRRRPVHRRRCRRRSLSDNAASKPLSDVGTSDKASSGEINGKGED